MVAICKCEFALPFAFSLKFWRASLVNLACETRIALRELDYDTYVCRIWNGRVASDED